MDAEGDSVTVNAAVGKLAQVAITRTGLKICIPARQPAPQLVAIEDEVLKSISKLKGHSCIFGEPLTLNQFLEPSDEEEIGGDSVEFEGPEGDETIVAVVSREMAEKRGKVIEIEESDDDESRKPEISRSEGLELCQKLKAACLQLGDATSPLALDLIKHIQLPWFHSSCSSVHVVTLFGRSHIFVTIRDVCSTV
ncbi:hypothetical protein PAXRUDRAFT_172896 [Paxillus rubicundulus Ve08.2h10]|uniref:Uncharacterized protein n=1 Tax=Paxillus rubicundulus Ve08.2h10 TaxID=930991 RepID=A0A0D0D5S9_9AGAM|nr:hypothetical protein PAXRUDRAFT_172896 [Paxillus rubicundulus Ve08.2h10]